MDWIATPIQIQKLSCKPMQTWCWCLKDFDGMFAIAIYDRNKEELFIARDRAGKKPLYYYLRWKKN